MPELNNGGTIRVRAPRNAPMRASTPPGLPVILGPVVPPFTYWDGYRSREVYNLHTGEPTFGFVIANLGAEDDAALIAYAVSTTSDPDQSDPDDWKLYARVVRAGNPASAGTESLIRDGSVVPQNGKTGCYPHALLAISDTRFLLTASNRLGDAGSHYLWLLDVDGDDVTVVDTLEYVIASNMLGDDGSVLGLGAIGKFLWGTPITDSYEGPTSVAFVTVSGDVLSATRSTVAMVVTGGFWTDGAVGCAVKYSSDIYQPFTVGASSITLGTPGSPDMGVTGLNPTLWSRELVSAGSSGQFFAPLFANYAAYAGGDFDADLTQVLLARFETDGSAVSLVDTADFSIVSPEMYGYGLIPAVLSDGKVVATNEQAGVGAGYWLDVFGIPTLVAAPALPSPAMSGTAGSRGWAGRFVLATPHGFWIFLQGTYADYGGDTHIVATWFPNPGTTEPTITTTFLPNATEYDSGYSATLEVTDTTGGTWSITSGELPNGLSLNATTGVISGDVDGQDPANDPFYFDLWFKYTDTATGLSDTVHLAITITALDNPMGIVANPFTQYNPSSPAVSVSRNFGGKLIIITSQDGEDVSAPIGAKLLHAAMRSQSSLDFDSHDRYGGFRYVAVAMTSPSDALIVAVGPPFACDNSQQGYASWSTWSLDVNAGAKLALWGQPAGDDFGDPYVAYTDDLVGTSRIADAPTLPEVGDTYVTTVNPDGLFLAKANRRNFP